MVNPNPAPAPQPAPNPRPVVAPLTMQQFIELGKLPDFIRYLQVFDGKPTELLAWLTDVEAIFDMYREAGASNAQLELIERSIRRKIRGEAADVLNANNIVHDWVQTKNTLILYYRDKRDLKTLDFELTSIKKSTNESLGSYYSRVNELLSSIIAHIQTEEKYFLHANSHIDYFRDKAIDSFIRGSEKPLCHLLKTFNPKTLNRAYQFCLDYFNMDTRAAPFRNEHSSNTPKPRELDVLRNPPRPPPRKLPPPPTPAPRNMEKFYQIDGTNVPYQQPHPNQFQASPRPWAQKPQPKPEPMEVDQSVRTRNVNYGNRRQVELKRPHPQSNQVHPVKRQAHPIDTTREDQVEDYYDYEYDYSYPYDPYQLYEEHQNYYPQTPADSEVQTNNVSQHDLQQDEQVPSTSTNFLDWNPSW